MEYETETQNTSSDSQSQESVSMVDETGIKTYVEILDVSINVRALKNFVNQLSVVNDECVIQIDPIDGLIVRLVDAAHVAMVETRLAIEVFEDWKYMPANAYIGKFGLNLDKMNAYLKGFGAKSLDDILRLNIDLVKMIMTIHAPNGERVMSLLDAEHMSNPKMPQLNLGTHITVHDAKSWRRMLKDSREISDYITIRYDQDKNQVFLESANETDKIQTILDSTVDVECGNENSKYSLEYLIDLSKVLPNGFKIELGTDYPIKLTYGATRILLAPRIESE
ncbi:MAG: hypothetical protein E4H14_19425 [Candidatus Thorarchaeota archaeon]|nr:MAG: hypothetical protein E4H14_19425 [Candidatus Thorarchaeota archaeon]